MTLKDLWIVACLGAALNLRSQEAPATNDVAQPRPVYRYLFLIDSSSAMSRQKEIAVDTVAKVIVNGAGGRFHTGDTWGIWTFDDQLHTNVIPAQLWDVRQRVGVADRVYRVLRDQHFRKKKGEWDAPVGLLAQEAERSGVLTVFVFTDGSQPIKGTPFDEPINSIFSKHAAGMRKAKKPFVIALLAQDGQFVAYSVSPGGEPIYIPPLPKSVASAKEPSVATNASPAQATLEKKPAATPTENSGPRKVLTVEEIEEALRQARLKQSNTVAAAPTNLIMRGTNLLTGPDATNAVPTPPASNAQAAPAASSPVASDTGQSPSPAPTRTNVPNPAPQSPTPVSEAATVVKADVPASATRNAPSNPVTLPSTDSVEAAAADATTDPPPPFSTPPQTATLAQPGTASSSWKYLVAAAGLLVLAFTLAWLYIRSIRYVPRPSLISRSIEKDKRKSG
jgi:hypothetical protein